jgi:hypothetical protein
MEDRLTGRRLCVLAYVLALTLCVLGATAAVASAEVTTFTATEKIPVPPASNFAGSGGGDGWAVALSSEAVYNVFHHQSYVEVACHLQSNAQPCSGWPKRVNEPGGSEFSSQPQPGLYLDQSTGKLYVFATRQSDKTGGVLCVETTSTATDPFCGFTALTGTGEAPPTQNRGISGMSNPMLIGTHLYSFNFAAGTPTGTEDEMTCFDVSSGSACAGQPYHVNIGPGTVETTGNEPIGETAAIAGKAIVPIEIEGASWLACFDDATQSSCGGQWPVKLSFGYVSDYGAPFPLLTATGTTTGICLPTGTDQCFNLQGESVETPAGMTEAIPETEEWDGPSVTLGPRVYLPNGDTDDVDCFDYSTGKTCANFPKHFENLELLYTVNVDPQRPTCLWVNSDDGADQIQSFDAYTGEACGQGAIRALGSQFIVPQPQCTPASYVSIQVIKPARGSYASGTVAFDNGDGLPIGLEERSLDGTGTASLAGLELNTPTGLPQFLFTINGETEQIGVVEVKLTWTGNYEASCVGSGVSVVKPTPPSTPTVTPTPKAGVAAYGVAHLASSTRACVASNRYQASVSGSLIASVTFTVNGRRVAKVTKANHGRYTAAIKVPTGHSEKLVIHVTYTSASKTHSATLKRTLARCAVHHHATAPTFTG